MSLCDLCNNNSVALDSQCIRCAARYLASLHNRQSAIRSAEIMEDSWPFSAGEMLAAMDTYNSERRAIRQ